MNKEKSDKLFIKLNLVKEFNKNIKLKLDLFNDRISDVSLLVNVHTLNLTGCNNISLGVNSLYENMYGNSNIVMGTESLSLSVDPINNIAIGYKSLKEDTHPSNNIAIGNLAMETTNNTEYNIAIGSQALNSMSGCYNNIGIGKNVGLNSMYFNNNIGIGSYALTESGGNLNIAIGFSAYSNADGSNNVCIGENSGLNLAGNSNIGIGKNSLNNILGNDNIIINNNSGFGNSKNISNLIQMGNSNIFSGTDYEISNTYSLFFGNNNGNEIKSSINYICIGHDNFNNIIGTNNNIFLGNNICAESPSNSNLFNNICIGNNVLYNNNTGTKNTSIGYQSLYNNINGENNIALGYRAGYTNTSDYSNIICLGTNSVATGNNQVILGTAGMDVYGGSYNNLSDFRDKTDIQNIDLGLEFIKKLRPVNYKFDFRKDYFIPEPIKEANETIEAFNLRKKNAKLANTLSNANLNKNGKFKHKRIHHGFIAQEVGDLGIFGGYQNHSLNGGDDIHTLNYSEFIAPMTKAIQELAEKNEQLEAKLNKLLNIILPKLNLSLDDL
jgi:hypothetical protein